MSFHQCDGPARQTVLSVTSTTPVLVKVSTSALARRQLVTLQPKDGKIYLFFADDIVSVPAPTQTDMSTKGAILFKSQLTTLEATEQQDIYIMAVSGTVNVVVIERA